MLFLSADGNLTAQYIQQGQQAYVNGYSNVVDLSQTGVQQQVQQVQQVQLQQQGAVQTNLIAICKFS